MLADADRDLVEGGNWDGTGFEFSVSFNHFGSQGATG